MNISYLYNTLNYKDLESHSLQKLVNQTKLSSVQHLVPLSSFSPTRCVTSSTGKDIVCRQ